MQGLDLDRVTDHGKIAGVCAGVADHWRIDPLLVRIGAVLLALCSGVGAVVYGAAWLLLPAKGAAEAPLMAKFPKAKQVPALWWYVIVGVLSLIAMGTLGQLMPISTGPVIAVAALWYFGIYRPGKRRASNARPRSGGAAGPVPGSPGPGSPVPGGHFPEGNFPGANVPEGNFPGAPVPNGNGPGANPPPSTTTFAPYDPQPQFGLGVEPEGYPDQWSGTSAGPAPHRARYQAEHGATTSLTRTGALVGPDAHAARRVRTIAIAAVAVAIIGLAVLDGTGLVTVPLLGYAATALLIVGVALVISAWTGRARGLLPLGCLMLALTVIGLGSLADDTDNPQFTETASYISVDEIPRPQSFDVAEVRVDMADLDLDRDATYTVTVDSGTVVVTVPRDANVVIDARVDVGTIKALEEQQQGVDLRQTSRSEPNPGGPVLTLDLAVDVGSVTVVRS